MVAGKLGVQKKRLESKPKHSSEHFTKGFIPCEKFKTNLLREIQFLSELALVGILCFPGEIQIVF